MQGGISGSSGINGLDLPSEQSARDLSELMDGELDGARAEREIIRLKSDGQSHEAWDTYHLIGDVMRGTAVNARKAAPSFGLRFNEQLALEPTVLAPVRILDRQPARGLSRKFQSYALSAAASVAAVAVVGWVAVNTLKPEATPGQLAQAPLVQSQPQLQSFQPQAQALVPVAAPVEHIHQYLLAHQGISPTTAIQGVAPYIRTVSSADE